MNNQFLIPANSKKSLLIFGAFTYFDLILFGTGLGITLILVLVVPMDNVYLTALALAPAGITGALVMPVPNYHNVLHVVQATINYLFIDTRTYMWKGWGFKDEFKD